jgi:TrpR family transcriptional regulator, trp operon repressor
MNFFPFLFTGFSLCSVRQKHNCQALTYIGRQAKSSPFSLLRQSEAIRINPTIFSRNPKADPMKTVTRELVDVFARTDDRKEMEVLFREIFTPSEIDTLTLRWQLLKDLYEGKTQRKIAAEHKISLCKITRGSKLLKARGSYLKKVLDDLYGNADND